MAGDSCSDPVVKPVTVGVRQVGVLFWEFVIQVSNTTTGFPVVGVKGRVLERLVPFTVEVNDQVLVPKRTIFFAIPKVVT